MRKARLSAANPQVRIGLTIQFESRADDVELARVVESAVWVNSAHAAYRRAVASRPEGYHLALAVTMALANVAVEPVKEGAFITQFLARWGASVDRRGVGRKGGDAAAVTGRHVDADAALCLHWSDAAASPS